MANNKRYQNKAYSLTPELIKKVKKAAEKQDRSESAVVRQALKQYFQEEKT